MDKGLLHIYYGNGKGKTTAAIGLAVRARGAGLRVLIIQFIKGRVTSELEVLKKSGIEIIRTTKEIGFVPYMNDTEKQDCYIEQQELLNAASVASVSGNYDVIILDEFLGAIETCMVHLNQAIKLIISRTNSVEMVLTGRNVPQELIDIADYVSEIDEIKHPYNKGQAARKGIEF